MVIKFDQWIIFKKIPIKVYFLDLDAFSLF